MTKIHSKISEHLKQAMRYWRYSESAKDIEDVGLEDILVTDVGKTIFLSTLSL
ncbi:MAG: hypothetical protein RTU92_01770 [Candidatus Thorarchaeota archaeon]